MHISAAKRGFSRTEMHKIANQPKSNPHRLSTYWALALGRMAPEGGKMAEYFWNAVSPLLHPGQVVESFFDAMSFLPVVILAVVFLPDVLILLARYK